MSQTVRPFIGTAYYPDYYPATDWPRDLDRMCSCGVTSEKPGRVLPEILAACRE
jgi:hypothetical protein